VISGGGIGTHNNGSITVQNSIVTENNATALTNGGGAG